MQTPYRKNELSIVSRSTESTNISVDGLAVELANKQFQMEFIF